MKADSSSSIRPIIRAEIRNSGRNSQAKPAVGRVQADAHRAVFGHHTLFDACYLPDMEWAA
jgi:hypothetical protein